MARKYLEVFSEVRSERAQHPRPRHTYIRNIKSITHFDLPELKLDHLITLTDDTGILQHATYTTPNRNHGYCTDDNARALMVAAMGHKYTLTDTQLYDSLSHQYLSFLLFAFNEETGRFRNFMSYARQWLEEVGSEDSHGRAIWSLGKVVTYLDHPGQLAMTTTLFNRALKVTENFYSPRAIAFTLIGLHGYLAKFAGDSEVRRIRDILAIRLFNQFKNNTQKTWPWLEDSLNYANGKLPHALLLSGHWMQRSDMTDMGIQSLQWLLTLQTEEGHFIPIGNHGWYPKDGSKARFDQQPIEACAMIEACVEAFNLTQEKIWIEHAVTCFNWFLGQNDLNMLLYDAKTGGCRDGLMADGISQNEGAESTLAWLLSLMTLQKLYADDISISPAHPTC